jgi:hypothetical protein
MFQAPLCPSSGAREYYTVRLLPVVFGALVFKSSVWCGGEGCVSGLRAAALAKAAAQLYNTLELLMMGIMVPEIC